jgi:hypothetical protein
MKRTLHLKTIALTFLFSLIFVAGLRGQVSETLTIPISNPNAPGMLNVNIIDGSISVKSHASKDVVVTASGRQHGYSKNKYKNKSGEERGNGMKKLSGNSLEYTVEEVDNKVYIKYQPGNWVIDFEVLVPQNFSVDLKTVNKGNIYVENLDGTHEVSNTNGAITMKDVGGSVIADALNKDIVVEFKKVQPNTPMMFTSLNGNLDISFPSDLKATVMARSDYGNVYTDFDLKPNPSASNHKSSQNGKVYKVKREKGVSGLINGGGADITFKTLNGDVLIRSNN